MKKIIPMIPKGLAKPGDFLLWKTNRKTPFHLDIGGWTEPLKEGICALNNTDVLNGYNHIGYLDMDPSFILHAAPPCCKREYMSFEWWNNHFKAADPELWRFNPELTDDEASRMCKAGYEVMDLKWNQKKMIYEGLKYDWPAIFPLFAILGINKEDWLHCAEAASDTAKRIDRILSSQGKYDSCVSPNNCINSGVLRKVWGWYLPDR